MGQKVGHIAKMYHLRLHFEQQYIDLCKTFTILVLNMNMTYLGSIYLIRVANKLIIVVGQLLEECTCTAGNRGQNRSLSQNIRFCLDFTLI